VRDAFQSSGGAGAGAKGGAGGTGGQDSAGPIMGSGCPSDICCGLADFAVATNFQGPQPGKNGGDGEAGRAGNGCRDPMGSFNATLWTGAQGQTGSDGSPGSGGGGGGAGGGVEMTYSDFVCEFPDGLGGGGGGGGAGGCGGRAGRGGTSGAPAIALFVREPSAFALENIAFVASEGGSGGSGGSGGDGGQGGAGSFGGSLDPKERTTPTLAGPFPGARGGSGGAGGGGGGGGGGCGGSAVGVWVVGPAPSNLNAWHGSGNGFVFYGGGAGGGGGGGVNPGSRGLQGKTVDVFIQP
jgi:hypothetical protein